MKLPRRPKKQADARQRRHEIQDIGNLLVLDAGKDDAGDQDAGHSAVKGHAAVPNVKDIEPTLGNHVVAVKNAPSQAAAGDDADRTVENEVIDLERHPGRPGPPRTVARQPPCPHESDQVHDAVPMHAQRTYAKNWADGNGDGIDVRIGEHGRYFKLSLTRQK
jgi:hypothetical protein